MNAQSNPVFVRLTRNCKWPSGRVALWLGFGLGIVTLFLMSRSVLHMKTVALGPLNSVLLIAALAVTLLTPPITAVVATVLTSRDVYSEPYELLRLTTLTGAAIARGYVFAVLYRMRLLISLTVGLVPALAVGMFQAGLVLGIIFSSYYSLQSAPVYSPEPPDARNIVEGSLAFIAMAIGLWGMNFLAATAGVGLALRLRGSIMANIVVPLIMLVITLSFPLSVLLFDELNLLTALCLSSIPYLLGVGVAYWTGRWVETHSD